jgi:hypothetical protein
MLMKFCLAAAMALMSTLCAASPQVEALAKCVSDSTTGKDRKDLARWLFVSMAAHPEMRSLASVAPSSNEDVSRVAGGLFTRLLADACAKEVRAAIQVGGPAAIQSAFQVLGQLAMQELMTDKEVTASMAVLERHLDRQKLDAAMRAQ